MGLVNCIHNVNRAVRLLKAVLKQFPGIFSVKMLTIWHDMTGSTLQLLKALPNLFVDQSMSWQVTVACIAFTSCSMPYSSRLKSSWFTVLTLLVLV